VSPVRILLVEDFEPFRRLVRIMLEQRASLKVVAEAIDGLDAIAKAQELQPDLVLIDIGLPRLNGMAAAVQICTLAPNAKLLFVSLESSDAAVQQVVQAGAHGYVHKLRTQFDLIPAVEAVLAGKRFVSSGLQYDHETPVVERHELHFYSDDTAFVEIAVRHAGIALNAGGSAIVFATPKHQDGVFQRLKQEAWDIDAAIRRGAYISLDVAATFSRTIVNGVPDGIRSAELMNRVLETSMKARKSEATRVAILSEWSALLCGDGNVQAAIHVESAGKAMIQNVPVDLLCTYPLETLYRYHEGDVFNHICAAHSGVFSL
jgi:CheY-like chemotaxis protein